MPGIFKVKFQILGPSRREAKEDDFSLGISAGYGEYDKAESGDRHEFTPFNGATVQASTSRYTMKTKAYDSNLIAGYRVKDTILMYSGFSLLRLDYKGTQTAFFLPKQEFSGSAVQKLLQLGFIIYGSKKEIKPEEKGGILDNGVTFLQAEADLALTKLNSTKDTVINGALTVGYAW